LTTAALLLKAGHAVTVLEAHVYAGGCAGTFFHRGYRFDAGATLVGGFAPGGPHARLADMLGLTWPVTPVDPAWVTHLPECSVAQWARPDSWRDERIRAFPRAEKFWRRQELLADLAWDISSRYFPWPPEEPDDLLALTAALRPRTLRAAPYLFSTIRDLGMGGRRGGDREFKTFVDAQLLIAAQTISDHTHALYGSAALDLPRRGVNHVRGGVGALAGTLVDWIRAQGGQVLLRQQVERIEPRGAGVSLVHCRTGLQWTADAVIANVTPWALAGLLGHQAPAVLQREVRLRPPTWGAFMLYLGVDGQALSPGLPTHHQVVMDPSQALGEGNSVFISLSEADDPARAPAGMRAVTVSTHTQIAPWSQLKRQDPQAYQARKAEYAERLWRAIDRALPGLRAATALTLSASPASFAYYTRRPGGMVGGFAQTSLFNVRGPATGVDGLWMVGDSIFPGQSTAGVTLGGMRVAQSVQRHLARWRPARGARTEHSASAPRRDQAHPQR
jgi:C-3',4' desaturase CrtD